jgi:hypothetical protein
MFVIDKYGRWLYNGHMSEQQKLDLAEPLSGKVTFRIQPSLKAVFEDRCKNSADGPIDAAAMIRRLMAQYVRETRQAVLK